MRVGELIGDLMGNMRRATTGNWSDAGWAQRGSSDGAGTRCTIYSGHDTNVGHLLSALGVFNQVSPPFAACVLIELHWRAEERDWVVRVYYRNESSLADAHETPADEPFLLDMPGSRFLCRYPTRIYILI